MDEENTVQEEKRLWIGNLDSKVTEYQLLKLLQKYGTIEKFDVLFHRSGPLAGQPRGYAFVTYVNREDSAAAIEKLDDLLLGEKHIKVTWAHKINIDEVEKPKVNLHIPALALSKSETKIDKESKIQAIEAKLKLMERKAEEELKINDTVATKPLVIAQYQFNKQQSGNGSTFKSKISVNDKKVDRRKKPYNKLKGYR